MQEDKAALRAEAYQLAEAQHAAVMAAESRSEQLATDNVQLRGLLGDMKAAVEALVHDNARLQAAALPALDLQAELETVQYAAPCVPASCVIWPDLLHVHFILGFFG